MSSSRRQPPLGAAMSLNLLCQSGKFVDGRFAIHRAIMGQTRPPRRTNAWHPQGDETRGRCGHQKEARSGVRVHAYPATLTADHDGGFTITFRDVPDAITEGDSRQEALLRSEG